MDWYLEEFGGYVCAVVIAVGPLGEVLGAEERHRWVNTLQVLPVVERVGWGGHWRAASGNHSAMAHQEPSGKLEMKPSKQYKATIDGLHISVRRPHHPWGRMPQLPLDIEPKQSENTVTHHAHRARRR